MYTVRLKMKNAISRHYCNQAVILSKDEINTGGLGIEMFLMSEQKAMKITKDLIINRANEIGLEYISVIEMTTFKPIRPFKVIFYQEFK